jgi:hypothetical protein
MDGAGEHHLKWSEPGSEGQKSPKVTCSLSFVACRPNTNAVILWNMVTLGGGYAQEE